MVTDFQVRKVKKYPSQGKTLEVGSLIAGLDEKIGLKSRDLESHPVNLPLCEQGIGELKKTHLMR